MDAAGFTNPELKPRTRVFNCGQGPLTRLTTAGAAPDGAKSDTASLLGCAAVSTAQLHGSVPESKHLQVAGPCNHWQAACSKIYAKDLPAHDLRFGSKSALVRKKKEKMGEQEKKHHHHHCHHTGHNCTGQSGKPHAVTLGSPACFRDAVCTLRALAPAPVVGGDDCPHCKNAKPFFFICKINNQSLSFCSYGLKHTERANLELGDGLPRPPGGRVGVGCRVIAYSALAPHFAGLRYLKVNVCARNI